MKAQTLINKYRRGLYAKGASLDLLDDDGERAKVERWIENQKRKKPESLQEASVALESVDSPTGFTQEKISRSERKPRTRDVSLKRLNEYPEIMTLEQVCEYLQISQRTIYRMIDKEQLPGLKRIGGNWRCIREKLRAWLSED